jgi:hypothetical protein
MFAALIALCTSLSLPVGPDATLFAPLSVGVAGPMASKVITLDGRAVTLQVELWRDLMPPVGAGGGKMQAAVNFSTTDSRGLPGITNVKVRFERSGGPTWSPQLLPVATFAYDPKSLMYGAAGGPKWSVNSRVTATVEFKVSGRTRRVDIPVRVAGVY